MSGEETLNCSSEGQKQERNQPGNKTKRALTDGTNKSNQREGRALFGHIIYTPIDFRPLLLRLVYLSAQRHSLHHRFTAARVVI